MSPAAYIELAPLKLITVFQRLVKNWESKSALGEKNLPEQMNEFTQY